MIEEEDEDETNTTEDLKLLKVTGDTLKKVVEFLEHHVDEPMEILTETPLQMTKLEECVGPEWYVKFADMDREEMFLLVKAANYMDVPPLLDLMCLAITMTIMDKSPEEVRVIFSKVNPSLAAPPQAAEADVEAAA